MGSGQTNTNLFDLVKSKKISLSISQIVSVGSFLITVGVFIGGFYQLEKKIEDIENSIRENGKSLHQVDINILKVEQKLSGIQEQDISNRLRSIETKVESILLVMDK
ncbi:hypothetical protein [Marinoscillum sp.]|uniref:hypothetical protein n=1 Tax=Marinoscillum sp. TaxID=2024838 RepID=UPI003BAAF7F5